MTYKQTFVGLAKVCLVVGFVALVGCVSTSDSRFSANADKDQALRKFTELGLLYIQQGNTVDAMPPLRRALEIDGKSANVHAALAMLFETEKDYPLAEKHFQQALKYSSASNTTRIRNNYASFLFKTDRLMDACGQLELASEDSFYELRSTVYENLGLCYLRLGNKDKALHAFERAVSIDDTRTRALLEASSLYFASNNIAKSKQYHRRYQKMVRLNTAPNTAKNLWLGVQLARLSGDKNGEASYGLKLRHMFPESPESKNFETAN